MGCHQGGESLQLLPFGVHGADAGPVEAGPEGLLRGARLVEDLVECRHPMRQGGLWAPAKAPARLERRDIETVLAPPGLQGRAVGGLAIVELDQLRIARRADLEKGGIELR